MRPSGYLFSIALIAACAGSPPEALARPAFDGAPREDISDDPSAQGLTDVPQLSQLLKAGCTFPGQPGEKGPDGTVRLSQLEPEVPVRKALPVDPLNKPINGLSCTMGLTKDGLRLPGIGIPNRFAKFTRLRHSMNAPDPKKNGHSEYTSRRGDIAMTQKEDLVPPLERQPMAMIAGKASSFAGKYDTGIEKRRTITRAYVNKKGKRYYRTFESGETAALYNYTPKKGTDNPADGLYRENQKIYLSDIKPDFVGCAISMDYLRMNDPATFAKVVEGKEWWKKHGKLTVFDPNAPAEPGAPVDPATGLPKPGRAIVCKLIDWGPHGRDTNKSIDLTPGAMIALGYCQPPKYSTQDAQEKCAARGNEGPVGNVLFSFATNSAPIGALSAVPDKIKTQDGNDCSKDLLAMQNSFNSDYYIPPKERGLAGKARKVFRTLNRYLNPFAGLDDY